MSSHRFSVIRLSQLRDHVDDLHHLPVCAGTFEAATLTRFAGALAQFPGAVETGADGATWAVSSPSQGRLEVRFNRNGSLEIHHQGSTNLVFAVFVQLQAIAADISLEDLETGTLHDRDSLSEWVHVDEDLPRLAVTA